MDYDVVIVGAGPAGAASARGLINEGLKVLIVERKKLPRYKICSGIIFKEAQDITEKYFGEIPESVYVTPKLLKGVRFWADNENFTDWSFQKERNGAPNVWRSAYDYWLIENSGAEVKDCCSLKGFYDYGDYLRVECTDGAHGKTIHITSKYLISAEGCKSTIRALLEPSFEKGLKWFIAYQNYYEGNSDLDPYFYHGFLEPHYGEVYAWYSTKDGLQVFGTAVRKGSKIYPCLQRYSEMLKERFGLKSGRLVRKVSCLGNDMCSTGNFYLGKGNVLLVGEAAGFLHAFGEGISCALSTGLLAAEAIHKSITAGGSALDFYSKLTAVERRQTKVSWRLGSKIAGRDLMPQ
ncbi:MAG: NAD(P)/FAD-dependent oxidoreductase [wastewater metagenome]|nr:NAD(P)/FAD-dependent oxidoreductase [Candidatus Loosdrechtia aerotolerans]